MATTVLVLGMHRSGTSCVARALHDGGVYLGDNLMNQTATDNLEGHWESNDAVQINEDILTASGCTWLNIPANLQLISPDGIEARIDQFLSKLAVHPVSGFKDPRTLLTYPLWKPRLNDYKIVACLRHPYSVARSLAARFENWPLEHGLQIWAAYNSRLLAYTEEAAAGTVLWFDFDAPPQLAEQTLQYVVKQLGLQPKGERFNQFLRHHDELPVISEPHLAELYHALQQRSKAQEAQLSADSNPHTPLTHEAIPGDHSLALVRQMRVVHARHDELIQRQQASLWALESRWQEAHTRCQRLEKIEARLVDLHQRSPAAFEDLARQCAEALQRAADLECRLGDAYLRFAEQQLAEQRLSENLEVLSDALHQHEQMQSQHAAVVLQFQERIRTLEQRLFWPLVARKARGALRRLRATLAPRSQVEQRAA